MTVYERLKQFIEAKKEYRWIEIHLKNGLECQGRVAWYDGSSVGIDSLDGTSQVVFYTWDLESYAVVFEKKPTLTR